MTETGTAQPDTRSPIEKPKGIQRTDQDTSAWDVVDEASWESFPASDPPGYIRGCVPLRTAEACPTREEPAGESAGSTK